MKHVIEGIAFAVFWIAVFGMMMGFVLAQDTNTTNNSTDMNSTNQTQGQNLTDNNQTNQTGNATMNETGQNQTQNNTNVTMPPSNQTEDDDNETEDETDEMKTRHGAEMRLFQLERRINLAILHMEAVIDVAKNKSNVSNSSSVAELESIVSEMKILLDEAKNISPVNTKEAVQKFVEVKKDAITLIHKFRKIVKSLLTSEDKRALKERFKQMDRDEFKDLKEKIHEKRGMLNAERARDFLRKLGVTDEEFLRNVEGGKIRDNEIRIKLKERIRESDDDEEFKKRIREDFEEDREKHKKRMMEAREKEHEEKADRMMKRAEKVRRMEGKMEKNKDSREGSNRGRR